MPIYKNNNVLIAYKGDYKPVNIYKGGEKIAGWEERTYTGTDLVITDTYDDDFHSLVLSGRYEQAGTPSIENPIYPKFGGDCTLYVGDSQIPLPALRSVPLFGDTLTSDTLTWDGAGWTFTQYSAEYEILGTETIIQWTAGGENWVSGNYIAFGIYLPVSGGTIDYCGICSHFPLVNNLGINYAGDADYNCFTMRTSPITAVIKIKWADLGFGSMPTYATALPVFRQWLTDQRTNGTPVKVWYIKTTATTSYPMLTVPKTTPKVTKVYDDGEVQTNKQVILKVFGRE